MALGEVINQSSVAKFEKMMTASRDNSAFVRVIQVYSPSFFWIINENTSQAFEVLMRNMSTYYKNNKYSLQIPRSLLQVGLNVIHEHNGEWLRATIEQVLPNDQLKIFLIDYGCFDVCHMKDVYFMIKGYHNLEGRAIPCGLHGIEPVSGDSWDETVCQFFAELASDKILCLYIGQIDVEKNSMSVALIDTSKSTDIHFDSLFVSKKFAIITNIANSPDPNNSELYTKKYLENCKLASSCICDSESQETSELNSESEEKPVSIDFIAKLDKSVKSHQNDGYSRTNKLLNLVEQNGSSQMKETFNFAFRPKIEHRVDKIEHRVENSSAASKKVNRLTYGPSVNVDLTNSQKKFDTQPPINLIKLSEKKRLWVLLYDGIFYSTIDEFRTVFTPFVNNDLILNAKQFFPIPFKWITKFQDPILYNLLLEKQIISDLMQGAFLMPLKTKYIFEFLTKLSIISSADWFDYESDGETYQKDINNLFILKIARKLINILHSMKENLLCN